MSGKSGGANAGMGQGAAMAGQQRVGMANQDYASSDRRRLPPMGQNAMPQDQSMNGLRMYQAYRNGANMGQVSQMNMQAMRPKQFLPPAMRPYIRPAPPTPALAPQPQPLYMPPQDLSDDLSR